MPRIKDITGQRFGRLIAIEEVGRARDRHVMWLCRCDCGNTCTVPSNVLKRGDTRSCGCLQDEANHMPKFKTHGMSKTRIYGTWKDMLCRCNNPNNKRYRNYGGRGITVCEEWKNDFQAFYDWAMANGYRDDLTIDRIDNDGNYDPSNCRWATYTEQGNNTSRNRLIEYNGEIHTVAEWAEEYGILYVTFYGRIKRGWSIDKAITTPVKKRP